MNDKIKVGFIRKAHGLKGEVKILPLTDDSRRFKKIKKLFLENSNESLIEYEVESVRIASDEVILKFKNVNVENVNIIPTINGTPFPFKSAFPSAPDSKYFIPT